MVSEGQRPGCGLTSPSGPGSCEVSQCGLELLSLTQGVLPGSLAAGQPLPLLCGFPQASWESEIQSLPEK